MFFFFFLFFFVKMERNGLSLVRLILHLNELIKFMFITQKFIILKINQQDLCLTFLFIYLCVFFFALKTLCLGLAWNLVI